VLIKNAGVRFNIPATVVDREQVESYGHG